MTLSEVLGNVGGITPVTASGREVYVIRGVEDLEQQKATVFQLNAQSPSAMILASRFEMQPQDVVFIGAAGVVRWNRFISQLIPSATLLNVTVETEDDLRSRNN
jgi:polysaccharide export outer membrane protein